MLNIFSIIWKNIKKTKKDAQNVVYNISMERELRQRRITEKWSINMLSDYYECSENQMRQLLDYFNIK